MKKPQSKKSKPAKVAAQKKTVKAQSCRNPKRSGRPTKYDPAMCERVIELAREGKSKAQIRRDLGIHHSTWADWTKEHPEFSAAVKESYDLAMAWWEDQGMKQMFRGMRFNATAYIFQMKNRFPAEYRDRQEHQVTGKDGGPIQSEYTLPNLDNVSDPKAMLRAFEEFRMGRTQTQH